MILLTWAFTLELTLTFLSSQAAWLYAGNSWDNFLQTLTADQGGRDGAGFCRDILQERERRAGEGGLNHILLLEMSRTDQHRVQAARGAVTCVPEPRGNDSTFYFPFYDADNSLTRSNTWRIGHVKPSRRNSQVTWIMGKLSVSVFESIGNKTKCQVTGGWADVSLQKPLQMSLVLQCLYPWHVPISGAILDTALG